MFVSLSLKKILILVGNVAVFLIISFVLEVSGLIFAPENQSINSLVNAIGCGLLIEAVFLLMMSDPQSRTLHILAILLLADFFSLISFNLVGHKSPIFENYDATRVTYRLPLWIGAIIAGLLGKKIGRRSSNIPPLQVQA